MDPATIQEQIATLQATLRPTSSSSVKIQLWWIFGLYCVSSVLHFATLCYKYISDRGSGLWLFRKNQPPGGGAAYITINPLLVWLPVALVVNAASLAAVYWFATSYEGADSDKTQHSMLAWSILPSIAIIVGSGPIAMSILYSALDQSNALREDGNKRMRIRMPLPPAWIWNALYILPIGFLISIMVTGCLANSHWNKGIDHGEVLWAAAQNLNASAIDMSVVQTMLKEGQAFESSAATANKLGQIAGYIWDSFVTTFFIMFIPSSIAVVAQLRKAITFSRTLNSRDARNLAVPGLVSASARRKSLFVNRKLHDAEKLHIYLILYILLVAVWCSSQMIVAYIRLANTISHHEADYASDEFFNLHVLVPNWLSSICSSLVGLVLLLRSVKTCGGRLGATSLSSKSAGQDASAAVPMSFIATETIADSGKDEEKYTNGRHSPFLSQIYVHQSTETESCNEHQFNESAQDFVTVRVDPKE